MSRGYLVIRNPGPAPGMWWRPPFWSVLGGQLACLGEVGFESGVDLAGE